MSVLVSFKYWTCQSVTHFAYILHGFIYVVVVVNVVIVVLIVVAVHNGLVVGYKSLSDTS